MRTNRLKPIDIWLRMFNIPVMERFSLNYGNKESRAWNFNSHRKGGRTWTFLNTIARCVSKKLPKQIVFFYSRQCCVLIKLLDKIKQWSVGIHNGFVINNCEMRKLLFWYFDCQMCLCWLGFRSFKTRYFVDSNFCTSPEAWRQMPLVRVINTRMLHEILLFK